MFEAGFTYILSKSLMNTRTKPEKSEPNFPNRKWVRIFCLLLKACYRFFLKQRSFLMMYGIRDDFYSGIDIF